MGSGHILVYAFDVLMDIYRSQGYSDRDGVRSILTNNIYGLEIDERAYHLAYFSLMMKALSYDRRVLSRRIQTNLAEIVETDESLTDEVLNRIDEYKEQGQYLVDLFKEAKEYGSILNVDLSLEDIYHLESRLEELKTNIDPSNLIDQAEKKILIEDLGPLVKQAKLLVQKYEVVITNPPYMAPSPKQKPYVKKHFHSVKTDLCTVFMQKCNQMISKGCYYSIINQQSWMFLFSFVGTRDYILNNGTFISFIHLGPGTFEDISGEVVQNCVYVYTNIDTNKEYNFKLIDLKEFYTANEKERRFIKRDFSALEVKQKKFILNDQFIFDYSPDIYNSKAQIGIIDSLYNVYRGPSFPSKQNLKYWQEVDYASISKTSEFEQKWVLCTRNGKKYRWFANISEIIEYDIIKKSSNFLTQNKSGILWNDSRFGNPAIIGRYKNIGSSYESALNFIECTDTEAAMLLSLLNLGYYEEILKGKINGQHFSPIYIKQLPVFTVNNDVCFYVSKIYDEFHKLERYDETSIHFISYVEKEKRISDEFYKREKNYLKSIKIGRASCRERV